MKIFDFPPLTESVVLRFTYLSCDNEIITESLITPNPSNAR